METRVSRPGKDGSFFIYQPSFLRDRVYISGRRPIQRRGTGTYLHGRVRTGKFPEKFLKRGGIGYGRDTMSNVQHDREISI